jgi:hypothetical protein
MTDRSDCYGDGNVYRGVRSKDSAVKTIWVGLTDEEVDDLLGNMSLGSVDEDVRLIEAKLKEKNYMTPEFNEWWDAEDLLAENPYSPETPIYWAWEGWQAARRRSNG